MHDTDAEHRLAEDHGRRPQRRLPHRPVGTFGLGNNGSVSASLVGTWLDKLEPPSSRPGGPIDCKGLYGTICATLAARSPNPQWRHKLRVTWNTPFAYGDWFKSLSLSAQWRYFGKVTLDASPANPQLNNPGVQCRPTQASARAATST